MKNAIIVDAGDFLFKHDHLPSTRRNSKKPLAPAAAKFLEMINAASGKQGLPTRDRKTAALLLLDFYKEMGYSIAGVGRKDLAAGHDFLRREAEKRGIILVSANLTRKDSTLFKPYAIVKKNGVRVGFTGVTACGAARDEVGCIAPVKALEDVVSILKKKCDFIILLSNVPDRENRKIAAVIPRIDLIIKSGRGNKTYTPLKYGSVPVVMTHPKGKSIGVITLTGSDGEPAKVENNLILLSGKYPMDKDAKTRVDTLMSKMKKQPKTVKKHGKARPAKIPFPFSINGTAGEKPVH